MRNFALHFEDLSNQNYFINILEKSQENRKIKIVFK